MPAEPALVALPALKLKFTVFAESVRVSDSARLAFKAIVCAPEFNCAEAIEAESVIANPTITAQEILTVFIFPPSVGKQQFLACMFAKARPMRGIS
jgi:hypothetical protein